MIGPDEDRRMIGVEFENPGMTMLAARTAESLDPAAAARTAQPTVAGPELKLGELGLRLDLGNRKRCGEMATEPALRDNSRFVAYTT
jgi:hypothetical protein